MGRLIEKSILFPIMVAVVIPTFIGLFKPSILGIVWDLLYWAAFLVVPIVVFGLVISWVNSDDSFFRIAGRYIRPIPPGIIYGSDLKYGGFPAVTISLITINTILYFTVPENIVEQLCLLPYDIPTLPHLLVTTLTSCFLHANFEHLLGNMIFLWAFGATLESRIGSDRFAVAYIACCLIKSFICLNLLFIQVRLTEDLSWLIHFHSLGASGAISGLMGIFIIRCYFARLSFTIPILFNPIFSIPVRINALILIGFFFASDLSGGIDQLAGEDVYINYWAHLGGFLGGLAVALSFRLHREAEPEAQHVRAERLGAKELKSGEATKLYEEILEKDPVDEPALHYFIERNKYNPENAEIYGTRLIKSYANKNFSKAIKVLEENYPKYLSGLDEGTLYRIGSAFYNKGEFEKALFCLSLAVGKNGTWKSKALLLKSRVYEALGNGAAARGILQELIYSETNEHFLEEAKSQLQTIY